MVSNSFEDWMVARIDARSQEAGRFPRPSAVVRAHDRVVPDDIRRVAHELFDPARAVLVVAADRKLVERSLAALGPVTVVPNPLSAP